jgi:hypothetical protein
MIEHIFSGIGILTAIATIAALAKWVLEGANARRYKGLQKQVEETADRMKELLQEENITAPEAQWAMHELVFVARTREHRGKENLRSTLCRFKNPKI